MLILRSEHRWGNEFYTKEVKGIDLSTASDEKIQKFLSDYAIKREQNPDNVTLRLMSKYKTDEMESNPFCLYSTDKDIIEFSRLFQQIAQVDVYEVDVENKRSSNISAVEAFIDTLNLRYLGDVNKVMKVLVNPENVRNGQLLRVRLAVDIQELLNTQLSKEVVDFIFSAAGTHRGVEYAIHRLTGEQGAKEVDYGNIRKSLHKLENQIEVAQIMMEEPQQR